jgi:hypothetical protein
MRKTVSVVTTLMLWSAGAQTSRALENSCEFSVQVSAKVQAKPAKITLAWPQDTCTLPACYTVFRKPPGAMSWGTGTRLPGTATSFADTNIAPGTAYEYQIVKSTAQYSGYGYISAGINLPATEARGRLLLVVDNTYMADLAVELARLEQDLVGDGWSVSRLVVGRKDSVVSVKKMIKSEYDADPQNVKCVFLFGHVPVPYSGDIVPDGHTPDHQGAWPCDGFYGDMDGVWTDNSVNNTSAADARTRNVPGDGKYDQSTFPAAIKLMVGRVDLANMPGRMTWDGAATFPTELELLRNYLNKDHKFRHNQFDLPRRGVVGDYFGTRNGEAFAASGWRNFGPLLDAANVTALPNKGTWVPTLKTNLYLWAYACGAGSYTSIAGIGNANSYKDGVTTELVQNDPKAAFTLLFGSWLGDWDSEDNLLRSVLACSSYGLASAWSGRPHWFLHHMALGETIGYGTRLVQNNRTSGLYQNQVNSCAGQIHIALMGDPTLRMHTVGPPSNLDASTVPAGMHLTWMPAADSVAGYHVYRAQNPSGPFTRLTTSLLSDTNYTHATGHAGAFTYMVRALKLESSPSGTYWNPSQGAFWSPLDTKGDFIAAQPLAATGNELARIVARPASATNAAGITTNSIPTATGTMMTNSTATATNTILAPTGRVLSQSSRVPNSVVWFDDKLPAGSAKGVTGRDVWSWVAKNPKPFSGVYANRSSNRNGLHQHYFTGADDTMTVNPGDKLLAFVYIDPDFPTSEIMLQWNDGTWDHRAYWGANKIQFGKDGTESRRYMGALPKAGQWARLEVPANQVGLEGRTLTGMAFCQFDGRVSYDYLGKTVSGSSTPPPNSITNSTIWVEDALPPGAAPGADGGDGWNWVSSNPTPFSGRSANQSSLTTGLHQHFFTAANAPMSVKAGDNLFAYVYIDPAHRPSEIMLRWYSGNWEHRAYWGANLIRQGVTGTTSRRYIGPVPKAGQWTRLQVPAAKVGLENLSVSGMSFSQFGGRATWDCAGKTGVSVPTSVPPIKPPPPVAWTNNSPPSATNEIPGLTTMDYAGLELPPVGGSALHILSPTLLELKLINTKQPNARVTQWDLVDGNGQFMTPSTGAFGVTADGQPIGVTSVAFKRRPLYAPFKMYDLRIENSMYLQLASPISDNQTVEVKNPSGSLWDSSTHFVATTHPLRFNPAIHVNQEGYLPNYAKKAMVGYYAGSMGEMSIPASGGFRIVDANTGAQVFQGALTARPDSGYTYAPTPYQNVYEADFTSFNTPGQYRLVIPGMGGSLPFGINDGITMAFARAYALGLYHQRCGGSLTMPNTRHTHDACHAAGASVPLPANSFPFTWNTVSNYSQIRNSDNPAQVAPALTSPAAQLFPFQRQGAFDTTGGHHDAGDYSKYTVNSASFIHYLMFAVDSLPGVGNLDNLGIPESGDGISDVLQEAKWEADYLAKIQDSDGGFYFLVYPKDREYEAAPPSPGDPQVVWPKTTCVTAASVAALAQCASSPRFKQAYPAEAAVYLQKAQLGWQFLKNAINRYGKNGAYQKITHYGDDFADNDELAWAACEMFLATGDPSIHQQLLAWFNPSDPATVRWGWWHMCQCFGHAIRSYAFAVRSGRVASNSQLDASFLGKCQAEIAAAGDLALNWSRMNAYGTSFPDATKRVLTAGWYFSTHQAFDMTVAYQLNAKPEYLDGMLANMNYEAGCNPVNVSYVTGLGWKRQRDIVSQCALYDTRHLLPPSGIPVGNVTGNFGYLWNYGGDLHALCFPSDNATTAPYPFYDRWGDSWNVSAEFVILNSARSLASLGFLAAQTSLQSQPWRPISAQISVPSGVVPVGTPVTLTLQVPGLSLTGARITWESRDHEPCFGNTCTVSPRNNGVQWVEAEALFPDGRRIFASGQYTANAPDIIWVNDTLPAGAIAGVEGGDNWNWVSANPTAQSGSLAHQSANVAGSHQHYFSGANSTLSIDPGDVLYAYIYLDPANPPSEIMLQWNDGTWEHRAYWGANTLAYGIEGTVGRRYMGPLPAAGQWVQLRIPASQIGLEGSTLNGMAFTLYGGRATWDTAGRLSQ